MVRWTFNRIGGVKPSFEHCIFSILLILFFSNTLNWQNIGTLINRSSLDHQYTEVSNSKWQLIYKRAGIYLY